ncbi:polysaccharide deacetylase family protein [Candidatus Uhrbacteria bacterium]|nr:polysaccharide deacetylase family protein [Candidatus Uhrbacteria bacterium]
MTGIKKTVAMLATATLFLSPQKAAPSEKAVTAPILLYHHVRNGKHQYNVQPNVFESQILWLRNNGYTFVTLSKLTDRLRNGTPLPNKPVVITFDDGWKNQHENAVPILKKYGATATFFVMAGAIGRGRCMTWENVRELADAGMEMGSHTVSHPFLTRISDAQVQNELKGSKRILEKKLSKKITSFAYPYGAGAGTDRIVEAVKSAGYQAARGVRQGIRHRLNRIFNLSTIEVPDGLEELIQLLERQNRFGEKQKE